MSHQSTLKDKAIDPVCGMEVVFGDSDIVAIVDGKKYYFCALGCRQTFEQNPHKFIKSKPAKRKGPWGRYLDRLQKCTGGKGLKCH